MKSKILSTIIIICLALCFVGCSADEEKEIVNYTSTDIIAEVTTATETEAEIENIYTSYNDFSEGLAWVEFSNNSGDYFGCIDKKGVLLFQFETSNISELTEFKNGYSHLISDTEMRIIDKEGNVTNTYSIDENHTVVAYGEGYIFTQDYAADFDSVLYTYNICDYNGEVLESFTLTEMKDYYGFGYFGSGVFGYYLSPFEWKLYFPSEDSWIDFNPAGNGTFYFNDSTSVMRVIYGGGSDSSDGFRGKLSLITVDGDVYDSLIPDDFGWNWNVGPLVGGKCILEEFMDDYLISYDVKSDTYKKIPESYAQKLDLDKMPDELSFDNNCIALPMIGDDGYSYVVGFDSTWNVILDPVKVDSDNFYGYSDERLVVDTGADIVVYDKKGEKIYSPSENGYTSIVPYSDGAARVENQPSPTYLDKDGKLLFDKIIESNT